MFKIGFSAYPSENNTAESEQHSVRQPAATPVKSVVQVYFPDRNRAYAYYNDAFDLRKGDLIYVEGKLEGLRGRVVDITYNFKIKLSDYKRVIGVADTKVTGEFHMVGSHLIAFDASVIPYEKILTWFQPPEKEDEEYASGSDDTSFSLDDLSGMKVTHEIAERGHDYYVQDRVCYLCLDGTHGRAIVEGSKAYTVEFAYRKDQISGLTCDCFCSYPCKHEFAVMLQLKDILGQIEKNYAGLFEKNEYFAAVSKSAFFALAVDGKEQGSFVMG